MTKIEEETVTEIDKEAETVEIPHSAKYIGDFACLAGRITSLDLKDTQIEVIGKYAFAQCHHLENVSFPACLREICIGAFQFCSNLKSLKFENGAKLKIGIRAFFYCSNIENPVLSDSIEVIEKSAFENCNKFVFIYLCHTQLQHIGKRAFGPGIGSFIGFPKTISTRSLIDNCYCRVGITYHHIAKIDEMDNFYLPKAFLRHNSSNEHVLIRRDIEKIMNYCFYRSKLVAVTIPASVVVIGKKAFSFLYNLERVRFAKNSQLREIEKEAFFSIHPLKYISFPKKLQILGKRSFSYNSIEKVVFPKDSQLEKLDEAFSITKIKRLYLPPSIRELTSPGFETPYLEYIYIKNDLYASNNDGTAIYSKDGSELIFILNKLKTFEIPEGVRVIKKTAFDSSKIFGSLFIPASVEVIEDEAFLFCDDLDTIVFSEGSRLRSIGINTFTELEDLILDNENFVMSENGVIISQNPKGIVFFPEKITNYEMEPDIEIIYSNAFALCPIQNFCFPKSLKKIGRGAFFESYITTITFEEGAELDFIDDDAFNRTEIINMKFPLIKEKLGDISEIYNLETIEFPPNFCPKKIKSFEVGESFKKFICPRSSIEAVASIISEKLAKINYSIEIIENQ